NNSNCMQAIVPVASCASVWSTRSAISCPGTSSPRSRCSSRIVRARDAISQSIPEAPRGASVAEHGADALDRVEVLALAQRPDRPAVGKRLVHCEVEPVLALLHARAVQRTRPTLRGETPARRALPGMVVGPVLEEQQLDAPVGGGLERLPPAGGGTTVATRRLAPALDRGGLLLSPPALEQRPDDLQQLSRSGVRLGRRPADDRLLHVVRELLLELGPCLLACDDDHARPSQLPELPLEGRRDVLEVVLNKLLDVSLVPRLRPAALIVA